MSGKGERALEGRSGPAQEVQLGIGAGPAQHLVPMRIASEAFENDAMAMGIIQLFGCSVAISRRRAVEGGSKQVDRLLQVGEAFAVLEGKIKELPALKIELPVEVLGNGSTGDLPGTLIAEKGLGGTAMDIPAELIEQQQQCKGRFRPMPPLIQFAHLRGVNGSAKARPDLLVEGLILLEPERSRRRREPELQHGAWCDHGGV